MSDKLKPCPFCGGKPRIGVVLDNRRNIMVYSPKCMGCSAEIGWFDSEAEAITAWNARDGADLAGLKAENKYLISRYATTREISIQLQDKLKETIGFAQKFKITAHHFQALLAAMTARAEAAEGENNGLDN